MSGILCGMKLIVVALLLVSAVTVTSAQQLTVAAAADLQFAMKDLSARFEKQTGIKVQATYGSSGNFATQIASGAPFDLFFSADLQYPEKLAKDGFALPDTLYRYAIGRLVLWVPNGSKIDVDKGLAVLTDPNIRKIAIANPQHAPYGRAAVAALKSAGIYDKIEAKFVLGENISQTAQFVESGNADAGLVALSLAISPAMKTRGRYVEVPQIAYPPIEQAAIVVKASKQGEAAAKFLAFLNTEEARGVLRSYGFSDPQK
jgi:molybdate transport system substrate-binding protein